MRGSVLLVSSCVLMSCAPQPPAAPPPIKIATWNINWLNRADDAGPTPRTEEDYAALARYAARLDADVISLQEVDGEEAARRIFDPDVYDFHFSSRDHMQRVGIVYKKSVQVRRNPDVVALARVHSERLRYGVDLTARRGNQSVRLLAVHLKSGCFSSPLDGPPVGRERQESCDTLKTQIPVIERWIARRARSNEPFVILGDYNRRLKPGEEVFSRMSGAAGGAGLGAPTLTSESECLGGRYPDFIDHLVMDARSLQRIEPGSFGVLDYEPDDHARHGKKLSDHCPVYLSFR